MSVGSLHRLDVWQSQTSALFGFTGSVYNTVTALRGTFSLADGWNAYGLFKSLEAPKAAALRTSDESNSRLLSLTLIYSISAGNIYL